MNVLQDISVQKTSRVTNPTTAQLATIVLTEQRTIMSIRAQWGRSGMRRAEYLLRIVSHVLVENTAEILAWRIPRESVTQVRINRGSDKECSCIVTFIK